MDLFAVFPDLVQATLPTSIGRDLRLIALSGIVYDEQDFYFEVGARRFWARLPNDQFIIGVGAPKVAPETAKSPLRLLQLHLRNTWRCEVNLFSAGYAYILNDGKPQKVLSEVNAAIPYYFILTPPKLGGANVPDALVQAVYLLPLRRWFKRRAQPRLLRVKRDALGTFLERENWELNHLLVQRWASMNTTTDLPRSARIRPVLALRGLQQLWSSGALIRDLQLETTSEEGA